MVTYLFTRRSAAAGERGKEDHQLRSAAEQRIAPFHQKLKDLRAGDGRPPRSALSDLTLDGEGRVDGITMGTGSFGTEAEYRMIVCCIAALRRRWWPRRKIGDCLMIRLCGQVVVDYAGSGPGQKGRMLDQLILAHDGTRRYTGNDLSGRLAEALAAGRSSRAAIRRSIWLLWWLGKTV